MVIFAGTNGHLDDVDVADIKEWEAGFFTFMKGRHPEVGASIRSEGQITKENEELLAKAISDFKEQFSAHKRKSEPALAGA
jgi:F-type H+-transporting ATPase subunit alpha